MVKFINLNLYLGEGVNGSVLGFIEYWGVRIVVESFWLLFFGCNVYNVFLIIYKSRENVIREKKLVIII